MTSERKRLIVVVTGANGGIGFGTCHRLLVQLSQPRPPDAQPCFTEDHTDTVDLSCDLSIIMACRSVQRAEAARDKLFSLLDTHIASIPDHTPAHDYARHFRTNLRLEIHPLDLSAISSVLDFSQSISQKYPYISHIICNAGIATYSHLDFVIFFRQCLESPLNALKHPLFNVQRAGVLSADNLGLVWQCNTFGHYVLFRSLQPLLSAYTSRHPSDPARVLWMSSVDAFPAYNPDDDPQLTKTTAPYQSSKSQLDLMIMHLSNRATSKHARHYIVSPGITATNVAAELLKPYVLELCMLLFFYVCRFIGSPHVLFTTYKASVAISHVALAPCRFIPSTADPDARDRPPAKRKSCGSTTASGSAFPKFTAMNDRWGNEFVGVEPISAWSEHPSEGARAVERCERLYQAFLEREKTGGGSNGRA